MSCFIFCFFGVFLKLPVSFSTFFIPKTVSRGQWWAGRNFLVENNLDVSFLIFGGKRFQ